MTRFCNAPAPFEDMGDSARASSCHLVFKMAAVRHVLGAGLASVSLSSFQPHSPASHVPLFSLALGSGGSGRSRGDSSDDDEISEHFLRAGSEEAAAAKAAEMQFHNDEWFLERRLHCCACRRAISSAGTKAGRRCSGCRRWFHLTCAPSGCSVGAGTALGPDRQSRSAPDQVAQWFHCKGCAQLRRRMQAAAVGSAQEAREAKEGLVQAAAGGSSGSPTEASGSSGPAERAATVVVLDLAALRQAGQGQAEEDSDDVEVERDRRPGPAKKDELPLRGRGAPSKQVAAALAAGANVEFDPRQRSPGLPSLPEQAASDQETQEPLASGGGARPALPVEGAAARRLLVGSAARRDLAAVAWIFSLVDSRQDLDDLLEADYALLARDPGSGRPVAAASLLMFGSDADDGHARVQCIATVPEARRQGHCRVLMGKAMAVLAGAGVPRLVVIYRPASDEDREGKKLQRKFAASFGLSELELPVLARYKAVFSDYHRDLTAGTAFVSRSLASPQ